MANDADMGSWNDLLHSSSKLLEQATPSAQFPPLQRDLDQLEALSKKLKAKTLRTEASTQSIAATRLLACEGMNAEQLARDLKSFELKTAFEDVFPAEATGMEEYLQQKKTYVVFAGREPGVYKTWEEANDQVSGFKNAYHSSFRSREEAGAAFSKYKKEHFGSSSTKSSNISSVSNSSSSRPLPDYNVKQTLEERLKSTVEAKDEALRERDRAREELTQLRSILSYLALGK